MSIALVCSKIWCHIGNGVMELYTIGGTTMETTGLLHYG